VEEVVAAFVEQAPGRREEARGKSEWRGGNSSSFLRARFVEEAEVAIGAWCTWLATPVDVLLRVYKAFRIPCA